MMVWLDFFLVTFVVALAWVSAIVAVVGIVVFAATLILRAWALAPRPRARR